MGGQSGTGLPGVIRLSILLARFNAQQSFAMNTVLKKLDVQALHDSDFYAWTQEQVRLLELGQFARLDMANLIDEIGDMGRSELRALKSAVKQALIHLAKLRYSPATEPRRGWVTSVAKQRDVIEELLHDSPSLQPQLASSFDDAWSRAAKIAATEIAAHGEFPGLPDACPFTLSQVRDDAFIPSSPPPNSPSDSIR